MKYLIPACFLWLVVSFWNRNALPAPDTLPSALASPPRQIPTDKRDVETDFNGVTYRVMPEYEYELRGMVVSLRQHDGNSRMHRRARDHLNVADLCVIWGDTAVSEHLDKLHFTNGIFTCNVSTRDDAAWRAFDMRELSNNHLISDDPVIRRAIRRVGVGDQVRLRGWLASYGAAGGPMRGTSTTRDDTGDGACETIFVDEFEIIGQNATQWRWSMWTALASLVVLLALYFRAPYRSQA